MFALILAVIAALSPNPPRDFLNQHLVFAQAQGTDSLYVTLAFSDIAVGHGYPVHISLKWKGDQCNARVDSLNTILTLDGPGHWTTETHRSRNLPRPCALQLTLSEDQRGKLWLTVAEENCRAYHSPRCAWNAPQMPQLMP